MVLAGFGWIPLLILEAFQGQFTSLNHLCAKALSYVFRFALMTTRHEQMDRFIAREF